MEINLLLENATEKLRHARFSHHEEDYNFRLMHIREALLMLAQYLDSIDPKSCKPDESSNGS